MSPTLRPIHDVASDLGLSSVDVIPWGRNRAKVSLDALTRREGSPQGRLVLVSAINPTPAGEGKTTTSVALAMGLNKIGKKGHHLSARALAGPGLRDEGRRHGRRPRDARTLGGHQPALHRRHPRHHVGAQPPRGHRGQRAALPRPGQPRPARHALAPRPRHERPRAAPRRGRHGQGQRPDARDGLRHHRGQRGDGHPLPRHLREGPRGPPRAHHRGHHPRGASPCARATSAPRRR